jgi:hypothetical protein
MIHGSFSMELLLLQVSLPQGTCEETFVGISKGVMSFVNDDEVKFAPSYAHFIAF